MLLWHKIYWYFSCKCAFYLPQFSRSVMSNSLRTHASQHARPPCPSPTPGVHPNPCPWSWWCHLTTSSSAVPFSSCPHLLLILQMPTQAALEPFRKPDVPPSPVFPKYSEGLINEHNPLHPTLFSVFYVRPDSLKVRSLLCEYSEPLAVPGRIDNKYQWLTGSVNGQMMANS